MNLELRISSRAEADMAAAFGWYQLRGVDLGIDFVRCVDATMGRLRQTPQIFRPRYGIMRQAMTPRFPYAVYFIWDEGPAWCRSGGSCICRKTFLLILSFEGDRKDGLVSRLRVHDSWGWLVK
jgi:plasmid stabilization system protein ParE